MKIALATRENEDDFRSVYVLKDADLFADAAFAGITDYTDLLPSDKMIKKVANDLKNNRVAKRKLIAFDIEAYNSIQSYKRFKFYEQIYKMFRYYAPEFKYAEFIFTPQSLLPVYEKEELTPLEYSQIQNRTVGLQGANIGFSLNKEESYITIDEEKFPFFKHLNSYGLSMDMRPWVIKRVDNKNEHPDGLGDDTVFVKTITVEPNGVGSFPYTYDNGKIVNIPNELKLTLDGFDALDGEHVLSLNTSNVVEGVLSANYTDA